MTTLIKQRRDTAANWTSANPTLAIGELGWETDTRKAKLGDGSTAWTGLSYIVGPDSSALNAGTSFAGDVTGLYNALKIQAISDDWAVTNDVTITTTSTLDDYATAATTSVIRWNGASALAWSGLTGGADGRVVFIFNVTAAQTLTLKHDATSTAANRFDLPGAADMALAPFSGIAIWYDATLSRWIVLGSKTVASHEAATDPHTGYVLESLVDAAGDLIVGTADNTVGRVAIGTDDKFLRSNGTTVAWEAVPFSLSFFVSGGGSAISTGIYPLWKAPFPCTVTAVKAYVDTGTTTVVNAGTGTPPEASDEDFCSSDITIDPADAWEDGTVDQNQAVAANETVSVEVKTAGTATQLTIQIDFTRP